MVREKNVKKYDFLFFYVMSVKNLGNKSFPLTLLSSSVVQWFLVDFPRY